MPTSKIFLPDSNVWLALLSRRHVHSHVAVHWLGGAGDRQLAFCRISQMGVLRLLTNRHVMGVDVRLPKEAWRVYEDALKDWRIRFLPEPGTLEGVWKNLTQNVPPNAWTDAYLMAFAQDQGLRIVTFDRGFERFGDPDTVILANG